MNRCTWARRQLVELPDHEPSGRAAAHVETCLTCQVEATRYLVLHRHLANLRADLAAAPADLASRVIAGIGETRDGARGWRVEWAAGAALALLGVAAIIRMRGHAARA